MLGQGKILLFILVFLFCFLLVAFLRGNFYYVNLSVNLWAASVNTGFFTLSAKVISVAFDTTALIVVSLVTAVFLFLLHHRRYSFLLLGAMAGDTLLVTGLKTMIASPRPLNGIIAETNFSFPSGHVTSAVVLFGLLTYLAWKHWDTVKTKALAGTIYVSIIALVSFDRVYLNVHWLSDVIGAVFLGAFWLSFCIYVFNRLTGEGKVKRFLTQQLTSERSSPIIS
jgi:undecaprenyl-diphosphatase